MNIGDFEFNNNEPIYFQIIEFIKRSIATGELKSGDKLPSVREMSSSLGVNPNTLQRAYGELERLGITYTKRGMGSFVSEGKEKPDELQDKMGKEIATKFLKDMKDIGISRKRAMKIIEVMEIE
ncbi:MAG: GntR family transcriptional regulator [Clostridium sp.]|uniref:GntR family transcriptional regulator n=1 Tax=Clostridium sp. TaxID=1506 RepID=UPI0030522C90